MGKRKEEIEMQKINRLGEERINNQGYLMKIVEYNNVRDIAVEFQDDYKERVHTSYNNFVNGRIANPVIIKQRFGETKLNNQGYLMKIVEYNNSLDIIVEFQDDYKAKVNTCYHHFVAGNIKNPYHASVCGVGMIGVKYPSRKNKKKLKEYEVWHHMLRRCFDKKVKEKRITYQDVTCCDEWLLYENFYEWLHSQENFDKWLNEKNWCLDKDILVKGNKIYSPETCCLVPNDVNVLFTKRDNCRGDLPIGVVKQGSKFRAECNNPFNSCDKYLGMYSTQEEAFSIYKEYKEKIIKNVAQIEHDNGNITKQCYEAMMDYQVEITD